jgi:hypothetical protein
MCVPLRVLPFWGSCWCRATALCCGRAEEVHGGGDAPLPLADAAQSHAVARQPGENKGARSETRRTRRAGPSGRKVEKRTAMRTRARGAWTQGTRDDEDAMWIGGGRVHVHVGRVAHWRTRVGERGPGPWGPRLWWSKRVYTGSGRRATRYAKLERQRQNTEQDTQNTPSGVWARYTIHEISAYIYLFGQEGGRGSPAPASRPSAVGRSEPELAFCRLLSISVDG